MKSGSVYRIRVNGGHDWLEIEYLGMGIFEVIGDSVDDDLEPRGIGYTDWDAEVEVAGDECITCSLEVGDVEVKPYCISAPNVAAVREAFRHFRVVPLRGERRLSG